MSFDFESYVQEGREFVNKVALALGNPDDRAHAARVISAFFHALRERISPEESLHFISPLPMFLKAVYVDGWKLSKTTYKADTITAFLNEIRKHSPLTAARDLGNDMEAERVIRNVISILRDYIDQGEFDDIRAQLPDEIASLFERVEV